MDVAGGGVHSPKRGAAAAFAGTARKHLAGILRGGGHPDMVTSGTMMMLCDTTAGLKLI